MKAIVIAKSGDKAYLELRKILKEHGYKLGTNTMIPEGNNRYGFEFQAIKMQGVAK